MRAAVVPAFGQPLVIEDRPVPEAGPGQAVVQMEASTTRASASQAQPYLPDAGEITNPLRSMYYETVSGSSDALTSACHAFGAGRLLFGTDYPYCNEREFRHHLSCLSERGLNADELRQVKGSTVATLLLPGYPAAGQQESPAARA
jgi:hypothetical protein